MTIRVRELDKKGHALEKSYLFKKPARFVSRVFIHCSASSNPAHDNIATIRKWHTTVTPSDPSKPWKDVGYHFYIRKSGLAELGRPIESTPAAQAGHNSNTIAICLGGLKMTDFTYWQLCTLQVLCADIAHELPHVTFHGHREVAPKDCPVFDYREVLGLSPSGVLGVNPMHISKIHPK